MNTRTRSHRREPKQKISYETYRCWLVAKSCPTLLLPHGLQPNGVLCPWDFLGKKTGVGCHFLLQGIFPTQGSNCDACLAGGFFTPEPPGEPMKDILFKIKDTTWQKSLPPLHLASGQKLHRGRHSVLTLREQNRALQSPGPCAPAMKGALPSQPVPFSTSLFRNASHRLIIHLGPIWLKHQL